MIIYLFSCGKCKYEFEVELETEGEKRAFCPKCGKPAERIYQFTAITPEDSKRRQGELNVRASLEAMKMAGEQKRIDEMTGANRMVEVKSYQEGKDYGKTERVPEKVIDSITKKVENELSE